MSTTESTGAIPVADLAPEAAAAPQAPEPEKKKQALTPYHVLRQIAPGSPGEPQRFELQAAFVQATSGAAAIRASVVSSDKAQSFIAPPSRSCKLVTVTTEVKTQMKLT